MKPELIQKVIQKYHEDQEKIKEVRARHEAELSELLAFQEKREQALLEGADMTAFSFLTDLFIQNRDAKSQKEKDKEIIGAKQGAIEQWLLKMLRTVGDGIKTPAGTVYLTRKESVTVADFDTFMNVNLLTPVAKTIIETFEQEAVYTVDDLIQIIRQTMPIELLTKGANKTACLELMGEQAKDGSRKNPPPAGLNYTAIQTVGVRKPTKK